MIYRFHVAIKTFKQKKIGPSSFNAIELYAQMSVDQLDLHFNWVSDTRGHNIWIA